MTLLQAFYYYAHANDGWNMKTLIAFILVLESTDTIISLHGMQRLLVTNWGDPSILRTRLYESNTSILITSLLIMTVQLFFANQIQRFNKRVWPLTCFMMLCSITAAGSKAIFQTCKAFSHNFARYSACHLFLRELFHLKKRHRRGTITLEVFRDCAQHHRCCGRSGILYSVDHSSEWRPEWIQNQANTTYRETDCAVYDDTGGAFNDDADCLYGLLFR